MSMEKSKSGKLELGKEYFGPLWKFVSNSEITDIDYNGRELWLTSIYNDRYQANKDFVDEFMTPAFVEQFSAKIANCVSKQFNKMNPELEAETSDLRVTIVHESVARSGRTISIRKTPPVVRLTEERAIAEGYCPEEVLTFLKNCVQCGLNMVIVGEPGSGKTELIKFLSQYIPANQRVITIEDTLEIRYNEINPGKDCVELKVNEEVFDYEKALKACLRMNPQWIILSEARSKEVKYLLQSWSTGISGMTTMHADDARKIPERIMNMLGSGWDADRLERDIYYAIDLGILIRRKLTKQGTIRYIDQIAVYDDYGINSARLLMENGALRKSGLALTERMRDVFARNGIKSPFKKYVAEPVLEEKDKFEKKRKKAIEKLEEWEFKEYNDVYDTILEPY